LDCTKERKEFALRYYDSDSSAKEREEWKNCSESWLMFDVIITTPAIDVGVDFSPKKPHFDLVFGFFTGKSVDYRIAFQMLQRVRQLNPDGCTYVCKDLQKPLQKPLTIQQSQQHMIQVFDKSMYHESNLTSIHRMMCPSVIEPRLHKEEEKEKKEKKETKEKKQKTDIVDTEEQPNQRPVVSDLDDGDTDCDILKEDESESDDEKESPAPFDPQHPFFVACGWSHFVNRSSKHDFSTWLSARISMTGADLSVFPLSKMLNHTKDET
jgi:hypothetical protein